MFSTQEMMGLMLMLYNYEPGIINIIEKYMTTYTFTSKKKLREAVNMWCEEETREEAEKKYGHISYWDTSKITNMSELFWNKCDFNDDISRWDSSNVTRMYFMFYKAEKFNQPLNEWDVSNVINMINMFYEAESFNQDISSWDVSNVIYQRHMFKETNSMKEENKPVFK